MISTKTLISSVKKFFSKHNSEILIFVSVSGLIATTASAIAATPKAERAVENKQKEQDEPLSVAQKVLTAAPYYIPTAAIGIANTVVIVLLTKHSKASIASLSGGYAVAVSRLNRYENAVKEICGEEVHREVIQKMETVPRVDQTVFAPGLVCSGFELPEDSKKRLFYDASSEIFFEATYEEVLQALYHLNRNFSLRGYSPENEYYAFLGIDCKSKLGWGLDQDIGFIDFSIYSGNKNGHDCYIIEPVFQPDLGDWD